MSLETLLEAAKFVEWSDQIGQARGQNDQDVPIFGQLDSGRLPEGEPMSSVPAVPSSPSSSPGSHKSFSPATSYSGHIQSTSNTDTFDEADDKRSGTREVHNKLEKNRRAHLKECFDNLRDTIPNMDDKKMKPSNLNILQGALRYLQALKRKERELEYETERLARQKIQYQEKLAKLSGCALPPWKKEEPATPEDAGGVADENDEDEDDRESVSTSTSTASEAEEEERKSRAHSPDVRMAQHPPTAEKRGQASLTPDPLADHVIKVTQSVKEQSGPFVISRRIVTHVPVPPGGGGEPVGMLHSGMQPAAGAGGVRPAEPAPQGPPTAFGGPRQPWVGGASWPAESAKPAAVVTQRVAATQKVVVRPPPGPQLPPPLRPQLPPPLPPLMGVQLSPLVSQTATASRPLKPGQPPAAVSVQPPPPPRPTSHVVRQFDSHSSAVSAVQEHLKNRAQGKLPQQQQQQQQQQSKPSVTSTTPRSASPADAVVSPKGGVMVVNAAAAAAAAAVAAAAASSPTSAASSSAAAAGASRQTVSQLLGKQPVVIRQPVRRTDNKYVMQRVVRHPFSPRPQAVDAMPKSPTAGSATGGQPVPSTVAMGTYKEPAVCLPSMSTTTTMTTGEGAGKPGRAPPLLQPSSPLASQPTAATTLAGLDMRTVISHGVVLPTVPHYLPGAGMLRPSLASSPGGLTPANAGLFTQGLLAGGAPARSMAPHFSLPGSKESSGTSSSSNNKPQVPASGPVSFLAPASATGQPGKVSQAAKAPSLAYSGPLAPVHPFLSPGLTLQPALTQVLFTQPPMAAYTVANSATPIGPRPLSKSAAGQHPQQTAARHSTAAAAGDTAQSTAATPAATVAAVTTVATTMSPVVTIGAISFSPLLPANRALVTAPTYTTLSIGQYPTYRFPFAGQVPFISPVALTGNPASVSGVPVTTAGHHHHHAAANGDTSNGMIVHTVAVPAVMPVTSAWLPSTTTISNGIPGKELARPASTMTSTLPGAIPVVSQDAVGPGVSGPHEGAVPDMKTPKGSVVSVKTSS